MRSDTTTSDVYIVDGGALLNQRNWNPQCTYNQLLEQYLQYVTSRYGNGGSKVAVVACSKLTIETLEQDVKYVQS